MPKFEQSVAITGNDVNRSMAAAYETFISLGWRVLYAGDLQIVGSSRAETISLSIENNILSVKSEAENKSVFASKKIHQQNTAAFIAEFQKQENILSVDKENENLAALTAIRAETVAAAEQQQKDAEEIQKAMFRHGSSLTVTYSLIGANLLVFILMAFAGAGIFEPDGYVMIKYGSNFSPLTLSGDWWRLLTNIFLHFGIIHLVMNMVALYQIGAYLEPMLGKIKFSIAYLCTGVLASLASLWWHSDGTNSAGASGAIFGMYGLFLALLTTDLIPKAVRDSLFKSIGVFVLFNLAYGMKGGIDNAAHIGGLVSGFVIGYLFVLMIRSEEKGKNMNSFLAIILLATAGGCFAFLSAHHASSADRAAIEKEISNNIGNGAEFNKIYNRFVEQQDKALTVMNDTTLTDEIKKTQLKNISLPAWNEAAVIADGFKKLELDDSQKKKVNAITEYISLRKQELNVAVKVLEQDKAAWDSLDIVRRKIDSVVTLIQ